MTHEPSDTLEQNLGELVKDCGHPVPEERLTASRTEFLSRLEDSSESKRKPKRTGILAMVSVAASITVSTGLLWFLLSSPSPGPAPDPTEVTSPQEERIKDLIGRLESENIAEREAAEVALQNLGEKARKALEKALKNAGADLKLRIEGVLVLLDRLRGSPVAYTKDGNIWIMDFNGENKKQVTRSGTDDRPSWSRDGKQLAFVSRRDGHSEIYVIDADGKKPRRLTRGTRFVDSPSWSPDGTRIAFWSSDGKTAEIYMMNRDGKKAKPITKHTGLGAMNSRPAWSADGKRIAFAAYRESNDVAVFVVDSTGKNRKCLTPEAGYNYEPAWSPDGKRIAFTSQRAGLVPDIHVMNADGSRLRRLTTHEAHDSNPIWTADSRRILFLSGRGNLSRGQIFVGETYIMDENGKNVALFMKGTIVLAVSPAGRK